MEIIVKGTAEKYYKPNEVTINVEFNFLSKTYEEALKEGTQNVEKFIKEVLEPMYVNKDKLKTKSFRISEESKYDYENKKQIKLGFSYTQKASVKFDYSMEKVSEFMKKTSELNKYPSYTLIFNLKEEEEAKAEVTKIAYEKAKQKAQNIAEAAGKELKECIKIDFRPFEENVISESVLDNSFFVKRSNMLSDTTLENAIQNIFTPEDICITETLYCLWLA